MKLIRSAHDSSTQIDYQIFLNGKSFLMRSSHGRGLLNENQYSGLEMALHRAQQLAGRNLAWTEHSPDKVLARTACGRYTLYKVGDLELYGTSTTDQHRMYASPGTVLTDAEEANFERWLKEGEAGSVYQPLVWVKA